MSNKLKKKHAYYISLKHLPLQPHQPTKSPKLTGGKSYKTNKQKTTICISKV